MPPRKRAETKPEPPATEPQGDETLPTEPQTPPIVDTPTTTPTPDEPPTSDDKPSKSDLQGVEQPCPVCFPNGWADGAFSHGCEHGTWIRDNT